MPLTALAGSLDRRIRLLLTLSLAIGLWGLADAASAQHAYVANTGSDTVSVIDTATRTVVGAPIHVGGTPFGVTFAPMSAPSPAAVPTLSEWAMILFILMLAAGAMVIIQQRRSAA